ncbi:MAG: hypothetical protein GQ557_01210 [Mycoplasmataceae bacterium]|nr:hypothetical protein [Mycoplasmataceae bacterium]
MAGRDYNIHINWRGTGSKQAFGGGNLAKMNRGTTQNNKELTAGNLKGFASLGMAFRVAQMGTEIQGSFTENRLRQRKQRVALTFAKYATGIAINPLLGGVYAGTDLMYRSLQYNIKVQKQNREADYYRRLSGNNSFSNSRYIRGVNYGL